MVKRFLSGALSIQILDRGCLVVDERLRVIGNLLDLFHLALRVPDVLYNIKLFLSLNLNNRRVQRIALG